MKYSALKLGFVQIFWQFRDQLLNPVSWGSQPSRGSALPGGKLLPLHISALAGLGPNTEVPVWISIWWLLGSQPLSYNTAVVSLPLWVSVLVSMAMWRQVEVGGRVSGKGPCETNSQTSSIMLFLISMWINVNYCNNIHCTYCIYYYTCTCCSFALKSNWTQWIGSIQQIEQHLISTSMWCSFLSTRATKTRIPFEKSQICTFKILVWLAIILKFDTFRCSFSISLGANWCFSIHIWFFIFLCQFKNINF